MGEVVHHRKSLPAVLSDGIFGKARPTRRFGFSVRRSTKLWEFSIVSTILWGVSMAQRDLVDVTLLLDFTKGDDLGRFQENRSRRCGAAHLYGRPSS
jgi:hypothetical protein